MVHRSKDVKEWYPQLNITPIWNVGYSFAFNPIESVFSKIKALFSRQRLNCLVNRKGFNFEREIEAAFRKITEEHARACIRKSYFLLARAANAQTPARMHDE